MSSIEILNWDTLTLTDFDGQVEYQSKEACLFNFDTKTVSMSESFSAGSTWSDDAAPVEERESPTPKPRTQRTLAPNLTRRSHKKSRGGCFNCKSRKIKCQETRPSCENCLLKEFGCEYPSKADQQSKPRRADDPSTAVVLSGSSVPRPVESPSEALSFTLTDFKFFHHFLTIAHPYMPLGNENVWVEEIPSYAQEHSYLMSAILGLGASHLNRVEAGSDYNTQAIIHRGRAIEGLNRALANPNRSVRESDVMLAACYALTFQASYMGDGLIDFITMVRGCALVTHRIVEEGVPTAFNMHDHIQLRVANPNLDHLPVVDLSILGDAMNALAEMEPILHTNVDQRFHTALFNVIVYLQQSSRAGYLSFIQLYSIFFNMSHEEFQIFVAPTNIICQLLLSYFVTIQLIVTPLAQHEWPEKADRYQAGILTGTIEWAERIFEKMPPEMEPYLRWPRDVVNIAKSEIADLAIDRPKVLRLRNRITE